MTSPQIIFPAEWAPQSAVQLTWPHENTDWCDMLDEVVPCFVNIAREVISHQKLIIACHNISEVKLQLGDLPLDNIIFREMETNDTWARDHGAISVFIDGKPTVLDFTFNGWGMKFAANHDNQITKKLYATNVFAPEVQYENRLRFVLEGGSLESDGKGVLLTTSECLLSENRNNMSREEVEQYLKENLGLHTIHWLDHGYLAGDDTDSHVDTLARLCSESVIAYVQCEDTADEHYSALKKMEEELQQLRQPNGQPYELIPLPMADAVYFEEERIPATYANFLIINGAVLLPTYDSPKDEIAIKQLQKAFPDREIVGINCLSLIKQHGSLHCVTMQYPAGFVL
jgi:Peptidylarginine deiminase and related enzymes